MRKLFGLAILAPAFLLAWAPTALAGDTDCPPAIASSTVDGNVIAEAGCGITSSTIKGSVKVTGDLVLISSTVEGSVEVESGAKLKDLNFSVVWGNLTADGAAQVNATNSDIIGNVQIKKIGTGGIILRANNMGIEGNVQIDGDGNPGSDAFVEGNMIGGDLQAEKFGDDLTISDNTIVGNLQCKDNNEVKVPVANNVGGVTQNANNSTGDC